MEERKPLAYVIIALVVVVMLGIWLFSGSREGNGSSGQGEDVAEEIPVSVKVEVKLTPEEKTGDVSSKKAEIMTKINSGAELTTEDKKEITLIMATKANIYNFTEEERKAIFAAFNR